MFGKTKTPTINLNTEVADTGFPYTYLATLRSGGRSQTWPYKVSIFDEDGVLIAETVAGPKDLDNNIQRAVITYLHNAYIPGTVRGSGVITKEALQ